MNFNRLRDALTGNERLLKKFREERKNALQQYVGNHYGDDGAESRVPLNLIELAAEIYVSHLAPENPRADVSTEFPSLMVAADKLEQALNHLIPEIRLGRHIERVVVESMFSMGICKVGLNYSKTVELGGVFHDVGQPFADYVDPEDFVWDTSARTWEEVTFMADKCVVTGGQLREAGLYDSDVVERLLKKSRRGSAKEEARDISIKDADRVEGLYDMYEIWNVYLPYEGKTVVLSHDVNEPLRVAEWQGPENGPYRFLSYSEVPSNILPLAPVSGWVDLHELTNVIYRKLGSQAKRQKTIFMAKGGSVKDAERLVKAGDGDVIRVDDPNGAKEIRFNGPDAQNMGFALQARNYFSYFAGNLDTLGGLSAQADTARQESLLDENSSFRMKRMSGKVKDFIGGVMADLAWYLFTDPFLEVPAVKEDKELNIRFERLITNSDMEGDFLDYNFSISPYSQRKPSPKEKERIIMGYLQQIGPFVQMMQEQGVTIDFANLTKLTSEYSDVPELRGIVRFQDEYPPEPYGEPPSRQLKPIQNAGGAKGEYKHTYESKSSMGGTESQLTQMAMGEGLQNNQAQALSGA